MAKPFLAPLLLVSFLFAGLTPAFSGQAFDELQSASATGGRAFDGSKNYSGSPEVSPKAAPELPGQAVRENAAEKPSAGKKAWEFTKKAAPYAFVAGAGLWMGIAVAGAFGLPAIAFAAIVVMLFVAAK